MFENDNILVVFANASEYQNDHAQKRKTSRVSVTLTFLQTCQSVGQSQQEM
jgi:hypothetical protein